MKCYITKNNLKNKCEKWLEYIKPFNEHKMELNKDKSALIVIDMQNFFLDPKSPTYTCGGIAIIPSVKKLIDTFRSAERPVIYTKHIHHPDNIDSGIMGWWWEGMCIEGSYESEICEELFPKPNEKIILKHRYSAFYNTDLETILRCLKIEDIVISGIMTNMCCESTTRDAYYRDYRVFFPADATASISEEMHLASLLNIGFGFGYVTKSDEILKNLESF